jgi:hypothetical protein
MYQREGYDLREAKGDGWNCDQCKDTKSKFHNNYRCTAKECVANSSVSCVTGGDACKTCVDRGYSGDNVCQELQTIAAHCPEGYVTEEPAGGCYSTQDMVCGSGKCYKAVDAPECGEGKRLAKANGVCSCECETGYHDNGNGGCAKDCAVVTCTAVTVPQNATCTQTCQAKNADCTNNGDEVCTAWKCNTGYRKNSAGTGCDADVFTIQYEYTDSCFPSISLEKSDNASISKTLSFSTKDITNMISGTYSLKYTLSSQGIPNLFTISQGGGTPKSFYVDYNGGAGGNIGSYNFAPSSTPYVIKSYCNGNSGSGSGGNSGCTQKVDVASVSCQPAGGVNNNFRYSCTAKIPAAFNSIEVGSVIFYYSSEPQYYPKEFTSSTTPQCRFLADKSGVARTISECTGSLTNGFCSCTYSRCE